MAPLPTPEEAPQALLELTTRLRKSAEATIVQAFRASIEGRSDGPTDDELKVFARLVAYETRLKHRQSTAQPTTESAPPPVGTPAAAPVPKAEWRRFSTLVAATVIAFVVGGGMTRLQMPTAAPMAATASTTAPATAPDAPVVVGAGLATPKQRPAARPIPSSTVKAIRKATSGTPWAVARCTGLNFLSRAICMNDACARASLNRQPVCADAVRQRRIDDARRNPLMLN